MPAFTAINLEVEDTAVDDEIDNTKQIEIDDAHKLFQNALKLHAQGAPYRADAADAYDALFESPIFSYPEASTEYDRTTRQPDPLLAPDVSSFAPLISDLAAAEADDSALPQAYYLAYKNRGQFLLDGIKYQKNSSGRDTESIFEETDVLDDARQALKDFNYALDRDPADAELWRRTARVAAFLKSARIGRYCLESAIELDDDPAVVEVEPTALAEGFAGEQLKSQLELLADDIALSHPIMTAYHKREISSLLKRYMDPLPWLPDPTKNLAVPKAAHRVDHHTSQLVLDVSEHSWSALGAAIAQAAQEVGLSARAFRIDLPDKPVVSREVASEQMEIDKQLRGPEEAAPVGEPKAVASPKPTSSEVLVEDRNPADGAEGEAAGEQQDGPTATPQINEQDQADQVKEEQPDRVVSLPSRKRSQSAAGLPEPGDDEGEAKRTKRTRRRDTQEVDPNAVFAMHREPFQFAEQNLYQLTKLILEKLGPNEGDDVVERLSNALESIASLNSLSKNAPQAEVDLQDCIRNFNEEQAKDLLKPWKAPEIGLNAFLEHTKANNQHGAESPAFDDEAGLQEFVDKNNGGWFVLQDIAFEWMVAMCESYTTSLWSENLKISVVQVLSRLDEALFDRVQHELHLIPEAEESSETLSKLDRYVEMAFELLLDIYERITNPNSAVQLTVRLETKARLGRWMDLAARMSRYTHRKPTEALSARFLWASVIYTTVEGSVQRDHILVLWDSLRNWLADADGPAIALPNNAVIPEISIRSADRELSKLTTMDFFYGLFNEEMGDPVSVIDTLEPVLNPESVLVTDSEDQTAEDVNGDSTNGESGKRSSPKKPIKDCASQGLRDLWKFLVGSSTDLRLFLWARLGDAYAAIGYSTKQFSCFFRGIDTVVADLERETYLNAPKESRRLALVKLLHAVDELTIRALGMALNDNTAFDIIDDDHIRSISSALAKLSCTLHTVAMYEDEVEVGMTQPAATGKTFQSFLTKLREMQVRTWSLQYTVLKVGIFQNKVVFPTPDADLADYLAAIHDVLGVRKYCKESNKIFPKMMRLELLKQTNIENWEEHLGQVVFDLYGLRLGVGTRQVEDHGCEDTDTLEKRGALHLVEKVFTLANRMPMKDLIKSELKTTIDSMQNVIGQGKSTHQMIHNLRYFTDYLKRPIHPLRLYAAWRGNIALDAITAYTPDAVLGKHGWFFLLGMMALTKFKVLETHRRNTPGATDDLRISAQYLRLQLQLTPDRWDAWFRLAECFDYELEEFVLWSAEKMNKEYDRKELVKLQRSSIHCYYLALSYSRGMLKGMSDTETASLHELYHNFGMRMYASSREPFDMEPFHHAEHERFFIQSVTMTTYKGILHTEMSEHKVWQYAGALFKKAITLKPKDWKNRWMYAKCLWKIYQSPIDKLATHDKESRPTPAILVEGLGAAIECVMKLPKPRNEKDLVLEPHYKIVSIVSKLVNRGDLDAQKGADILSRQPYAPSSDGKVDIKTPADWRSYLVKSLRRLRDKDKANWQHRMINRHARVLFEMPTSTEMTDEDTVEAGKAAFTVLKESMFTKTMAINVWKCPIERHGRHHVYTGQYVQLMLRVLTAIDDRANMDALLRRIRRKGADFYHFNDLWQTCVSSYVSLIRKDFQIIPTDDDVYRNVSPEEFEILSERITEWVGQPGSEHRALSAMKEAVELKKLNSTLMKAVAIDDLVCDCYSAIYADIARTLPGDDPAKLIEERNRAKHEQNGQPQGADAEQDGKKLPSKTLPFKFNDPADSGPSRAGSEVPDKAEKQGEPQVRRGRMPGVRRLEIMRKADQAVMRLTEAPPRSAVGAGAGSARGESSRRSRHGSAVSGASRLGREDVDMKDDDESPPGSVHSDADDESDLSDVPPDYEDNAPELLFPNLRRSVDAGSVADSEEEEGSDLEEGAEGDPHEEEHEDEDGEEDLEGEEGQEVDGEDEEGTELIEEEGVTAIEETEIEETEAEGPDLEESHLDADVEDGADEDDDGEEVEDEPEDDIGQALGDEDSTEEEDDDDDEDEAEEAAEDEAEEDEDDDEEMHDAPEQPLQTPVSGDEEEL